MAEAGTLEASHREGAGTGPARAVRRTGKVPGILYGGGGEPVLISIEDRAMRNAMHQPNFFSKPLQLKLDGKTVQVLPREIQTHPITDAPVHADFLRVTPQTRIRIRVPVYFEHEAESPGLKRGGVLNIVRHDVEVACTVATIPDHFTVDLSGLDIGDSVHISSVAMPEGVKPTIARDFTVATIAAPTIAVEEEKPAEETVEGEEAAAAPEEGEEAEGEKEEKEGKEKKEGKGEAE